MHSYAIIGTGALGGYYGALLQRAGADVHFLLHSDYDHVRRHGLVIDSRNGDFALPRVNAYADAHTMPRCDIAFIALKATHNHLLAEILPHVLKPDGVALLVQNGLNMEDTVAAIVGPERTAGGLSFLCSNKVGPGHIHHLDYGRITLAEYVADPDAAPPGVTRRLRKIGKDLKTAGVPVELADDLLLARWKKLVWNVPFNGLSVLLNATTAELMADTASRTLAEGLMREVAAAAAAYHRTIDDAFIAAMLADTAKMAAYRTSMKIDFDAQRPMEVEAIFANPCKAAAARGVATPLLHALRHAVQFLDARNVAGSPVESYR